MKVIVRYLRIILPHLGISFIVIALVLGYFFNWRGKAVLLSTDKTNLFITKNKELKIVPYALTLKDLKIERYDSGEPKSIKANIYVEEIYTTKEISLQVNHPFKMGFGQDLYLSSYNNNYENPDYCVVELVHEPYQGILLAGLIILISGLIFAYLPLPLK